jgi:hypothetical protein
MVFKKIRGIEFDSDAHKVITNLIKKLELSTDMIYPLKRTNNGKGQLRFAHHGPDLQHPKARGVFARINPTLLGATLIRRRRNGPHSPVFLSKTTFDLAFSNISFAKKLMKDKLVGSEKAAPNKPGTVSGGQFESNRRKH